jgi:hypothetical protein
MNLNQQQLEEEQYHRTFLRERFLNMFKYLSNNNKNANSSNFEKNIQFNMFQGACVNAKFKSIDYDILNIHVTDLQTPIGCVPQALLRYNDIVSFSFKLE